MYIYDNDNDNDNDNENIFIAMNYSKQSVHSLYEFYYRSYIQRDCHSVVAKLHPITFYRECAVPGLNAILCFLWFSNCVLLFDENLILECL